MPWQLQNNTLLLWTLEPIGQEALKLQVRQRKRELVQAVCQRDSLGMQEAFPEEFEVPYHPELALTNEPIVHRYFSSDLAQVFGRPRIAWRKRRTGRTPSSAKCVAIGGRRGRRRAHPRRPPSWRRCWRTRKKTSGSTAGRWLNSRWPVNSPRCCSIPRRSISPVAAWPTCANAGRRISREDDRRRLANLIAWSISVDARFKLDSLAEPTTE